MLKRGGQCFEALGAKRHHAIERSRGDRPANEASGDYEPDPRGLKLAVDAERKQAGRRRDLARDDDRREAQEEWPTQGPPD